MLTTSIIICTCNRPKDIIICLKSLAQQTITPDEIIIVDSSDTPIEQNQTFNTMFNTKIFTQSKLIYKHTAKGLTYQRNIGTKLASKDIIYFFDDDVILENDYIEQMNLTFAQHPNYAGGMGSVTNIPPKKNNAHRFLRHLFLLQRLYSSGKFTLSGQPTHAYGQVQFKTVEVLGGCCMAYRKHVFDKHTFDEQLTRYAYMEDCDFSYRVSRDAPLFYNPMARMQHMQSPLDRDKAIDNRAMYMRNYKYLFFKNIYPQNKLKIIPFFWSILGLFFDALLYRKHMFIRGYIKGLYN